MCPDYPVTSYTVVVEDSDGAQIKITSNSSEISVANLTEDSSYKYHVIPTNQFGDGIPSTPFEFRKCGF